jgi:hemoglobin-like flavoprotein
MTIEQVHLLRKSYQRVEAMGHVAALAFYRRLFALAPEVRPMFRTDIESQAKKLTEMLTAALSLLDKPADLEATLEHLGARHVQYGAKPEHYPIVARALLDMLAEVMGADFTTETRAAWTQLLGGIANTMLHGAAKAA